MGFPQEKKNFLRIYTLLLEQSFTDIMTSVTNRFCM